MWPSGALQQNLHGSQRGRAHIQSMTQLCKGGGVWGMGFPQARLDEGPRVHPPWDNSAAHNRELNQLRTVQAGQKFHTHGGLQPQRIRHGPPAAAEELDAYPRRQGCQSHCHTKLMWPTNISFSKGCWHPVFPVRAEVRLCCWVRVQF